MTTTQAPPRVYGLMAEFLHAEDLVEAARRAHDEGGYRNMDAYSPYPVEGLAEAIGFRKNAMARIVFLGGLAGAIIGFVMQWYSATIDYALNIGGRPLNSWPVFIPVTFEVTVLLASFSAVLGMLGLNGLPRPYHPVFNAPNFALASRNRFFLCIQANDPKFDRQATQAYLEGLGPKQVTEVDF